jgi:hypothetical protein
MWPFTKKKTLDNTIMMIRYTKDAWMELFPNSTTKEWELTNCPEDVFDFVKTSVSNSMIRRSPIQKGIIATIDGRYMEWLSKSRLIHSAKSLTQYLEQHITDTRYWDERLVASGMIDTYNRLGIPCLVMLHNIRGSQSEYALSKEASDQLMQILSNVYGSDAVFSPGWITKGCDMPIYSNDLVQIANIFWKDKTRIRFGKYLEQRYSQLELIDKFSPLYFVVPFVVKDKVDQALINFGESEFAEKDKSAQAMAARKFTDEQRIELFHIISRDIPQVVSIGPRAVMPNQAYINYTANIIRSRGRSNLSMY